MLCEKICKYHYSGEYMVRAEGWLSNNQFFPLIVVMLSTESLTIP